MTLEQVLIGIFGAINLLAFVVMAYDKRLSQQRGETERTPEGVIFFVATALGAVGVYLGMIVFRHKTRKWYFQVGIPLLIFQNLAILYVIRDFLI